jgi:hypothetical protein
VVAYCSTLVTGRGRNVAKLKGGLTVHFLDNDLHFSENHNGWLHPDAGGPMAVVACVAQSQLAVG